MAWRTQFFKDNKYIISLGIIRDLDEAANLPKLNAFNHPFGTHSLSQHHRYLRYLKESVDGVI